MLSGSGLRHAARRVGAALAGTLALAAVPAGAAPVAASPAASAAAAPREAPRTDKLLVGTQGGIAGLAAAVAAAPDGSVIELLEGEYRGHLVLENRRLTLRGLGKVVWAGEGRPLRERALLTVRGGEVMVEGIEFRGMRAQDGAGSAIRHEGGRLVLRSSRFFDNEHGLVATHDEKAELVIEGCVFGLAPRVEGGLHHLLNVGRIGRLSITGTRFQQGYEGHLIKSRAREAFIGYNFIHDSQRGGASYEIELAEGGLATVIGNVIGQGASTMNRVAIAYGSEGGRWPSNRLLLAHNTIVNYGWIPGRFLRVHGEGLGGKPEIVAVNNLLVGLGLFSLGVDGRFEGNRQVFANQLRDIDTYGFELPAGSGARKAAVDPRSIGGHDLEPRAEFEWPTGTKALPAGRTSWVPGAFQR